MGVKAAVGWRQFGRHLAFSADHVQAVHRRGCLFVMKHVRSSCAIIEKLSRFGPISGAAGLSRERAW
jgi:hypothetical protein